MNMMNSMPMYQWGAFQQPVFMPNMGSNINFGQMNSSDMIHPNQDPSSIPNPLTGVKSLTST
jgi:hypothetical protein